MALFATLAAATLVSEDLACIAAGLLIQQGRLDPLTGIAACVAGIFAGDLGLYGIGRLLGDRAAEWRRVARFLTPPRREAFSTWFGSHGATAILVSRFVPGTRVALYVSCGVLGASPVRFAAYVLGAVLLWTPMLVLASARSTEVPNPWMASATPIVVLHLLRLAATRRGRQRAIARVSRVWRWEFWPMWLFYAPVACWIAWLVVRHRGIGALAAANPGMQDGGIVGESKHEILSGLPADFTLDATLIAPGSTDARMWRFLHHYTHKAWSFPLVFKPDVGQRGTGVKVVRSLAAAADYLERDPGPIVVQSYHPGPFEAGVFYYRFPEWPRGKILSVTDKHFPCVAGDGVSTLEDLVWSHPRLRMQAGTFLTRHAAERERVLAAGERFVLAQAGNHAQGTLFKDGAHLVTPELEERIDRIARDYQGFFVGRFDVRYSDVDRFKAGEDLAIVELNGATAESTNIYDPDGSLIAAYRQLFRQWSIVFAIGAANRARGASSTPLRRLVQIVRTHLASKPAFQTSD